MSIIGRPQLDQWLEYDFDNEVAANRAIRTASNLTNTWAVHYLPFPDATDNGDGSFTTNAPDEIVDYCTEIAYYQYRKIIGHIDRDDLGRNQDTIRLKQIHEELKKIIIEPLIRSVTISLNSNGVQLLERNTAILPAHPQSRVDSGTTNIWNREEHWIIRKGQFEDQQEHTDGWYLDAESYEDEIEGTLYYAKSWRNDGYDYHRFQDSNRAI